MPFLLIWGVLPVANRRLFLAISCKLQSKGEMTKEGLHSYTFRGRGLEFPCTFMYEVFYYFYRVSVQLYFTTVLSMSLRDT